MADPDHHIQKLISDCGRESSKLSNQQPGGQTCPNKACIGERLRACLPAGCQRPYWLAQPRNEPVTAAGGIGILPL